MKEEPSKVIIRGLRRTFYPPVHHAPMDNSPPDKKLQLQWVHGYRGIDSRRNLWVLPSGELLYYVAAVAVLLDRDEESQRHYTGHTEDIMWCVWIRKKRFRKDYQQLNLTRSLILLKYGRSSIAGAGSIRPASWSRTQVAGARAHLEHGVTANVVRVWNGRTGRRCVVGRLLTAGTIKGKFLSIVYI